MKSANLDSTMFEAISTELLNASKKIAFGTVGAVLTLHNGEIVKIDYAKTELKRTEVKK